MTKKPAKRGRPILPDGERKRVFALRLSDNDLARLQERADVQGMTIRELATLGLKALIDEAVSKKPQKKQATAS